MAEIRRLEVPEGMILVRGAMQNWSDLELLGPQPVQDMLVDRHLPEHCGRALVAGPHAPELVSRVAAVADEVLVVVRAAADGAEIIRACSARNVRVKVGFLDAALTDEAPFDLVVALHDVALLASVEADPVLWAELADQLAAVRATDGVLLLGIESDLGPQRAGAPLPPGARDDDADWSVFSTWDESRPRSREQVRQWLDQVGEGSNAHDSGLWQTPLVWPGATIAYSELGSAPMRRTLARAVGATELDVLTVRSLSLADRLVDDPSGWIVVVGAPVEGEQVWQWSRDQVLRWTSAHPASDPVAPTLLHQWVVAAADHAVPNMRSLLRQWRDGVYALAPDGQLAAEDSDIRLGNCTFDADGSLVTTLPGSAARPVDEAITDALVDLLHVVFSQGLRHPWPSNKSHARIFEALCAMAGTPRHADSAKLVQALDEPGAAPTVQQLQAVIERQNEELHGAWARFAWDEKRYAVHKGADLAGRAVRKLRRAPGIGPVLRRLG